MKKILLITVLSIIQHASCSNMASENKSVDTSRPDVSISSPADNQTVGRCSLTITGKAADNQKVKSLKIKINGKEDNIPIVEKWTYICDTNQLPEGKHQVIVTATDGMNNVNMDSVVFSVDLDYPVVELGNLPEKYSNKKEAEIKVSGNNIVSYKYKIDSADWSPETNVNIPVKLSLEEGSHVLLVKGKNNIGTWNSDATQSKHEWTIDTTKPAGSVEIENCETISYSRSINILANITGSDLMRFSNDGASWSDWEKFSSAKKWDLSEGNGEKTLYCDFKDSAGNVLSSKNDIYLKDIYSEFSFSLNSGDHDTVFLETVTLESTVTGFSKMRFSNDGRSWCEWVPFSPVYEDWFLSDGFGEKNVHAQFIDGSGNIICFNKRIALLDLKTENPPPVGSFGSSLAFSKDGTVLVAGAGNADKSKNIKGRVFLSKKIDGTFYQYNIIAPDGHPADSFGQSVSVSGDGSVVVVGAPTLSVNGKENHGALYIFRWNPDEFSWDCFEMTPENSSNLFLGSSVSVSDDGETIAAACLGYKYGEKANNGAVFVYELYGNNYVETKITPDNQQENLFFGRSVSMSGNGNLLIVGADGYSDVNYVNRGSVYTIEKNGAFWVSNILTANDPSDDDRLGTAVDVSADGKFFFASATGKNGKGSVYKFKFDGFAWLSEKLSVPGLDSILSIGSMFGYAICVRDENNIAVSAKYQDSGSLKSCGAVFTLKKSSTWEFNKILSTEKEHNNTGHCVKFFKNWLLFSSIDEKDGIVYKHYINE